MRVQLKGIHTTTKRLADGSRRTYYYLGKNGPRLEGKPGSPEFLASYQAAAAQKVGMPGDVLLSILRDYQNSTAFTDLAERARKDYVGIIAKIEKEFGDLPLTGINKEPDEARGEFLELRDKLAKKSWRQAGLCVGRAVFDPEVGCGARQDPRQPVQEFRFAPL